MLQAPYLSTENNQWVKFTTKVQKLFTFKTFLIENYFTLKAITLLMQTLLSWFEKNGKDICIQRKINSAEGSRICWETWSRLPHSMEGVKHKLMKNSFSPTWICYVVLKANLIALNAKCLSVHYYIPYQCSYKFPCSWIFDDRTMKLMVIDIHAFFAFFACCRSTSMKASR